MIFLKIGWVKPRDEQIAGYNFKAILVNTFILLVVLLYLSQ